MDKMKNTYTGTVTISAEEFARIIKSEECVKALLDHPYVTECTNGDLMVLFGEEPLEWVLKRWFPDEVENRKEAARAEYRAAHPKTEEVQAE